MTQERHKLLTRLIDRSIKTSGALVLLLASAALASTLGLLTAQTRLSDAFRALMAADAISGQVSAMRLSMAAWVLRGDDAARSDWMRLAHQASGELANLQGRAAADPQGTRLIRAVAVRLSERVETAAPLLTERPGGANAQVVEMMGRAYQTQNSELGVALDELRTFQTQRVETLQRREHVVLLMAGSALFALVAWAAFGLRRSQRTAKAMVRSLRDAFAALERGRAELSAITDAAPLAMVHTDADGRPLWLNAHAVEWLSTREPGDVPSLFENRLHPQDRDRVRSAWDALVSGGERFDQTFRLLGGAVTPVWAESHAVPVRVNGVTTGFIAVLQDITATRALQDELGRSRTRLQRMADSVPAMLAHLDGTQTYQFVNATYAHWFGRGAPQVGTTIREFLGDTAYERLRPSIEGVLCGRSVRLEMAQDNLHGLAFVGDVTYTPEFDEEGRVCGFYVLVTDVTERKRLEDRLYSAKEMAQVTLDSLGDAVVTTDARGIVTFLNRRAQVLLAPTARRALGLHVDQVVQLIDSMGRMGHSSLSRAIEEERHVDMLAARKLPLADGSDVEIEDVASPIRTRDGTVAGGVLVLRDVSAAQAMANRMRELAESDVLTGLPNRLVFDQRLADALHHLATDEPMAVLYMDLDGFKRVNDIHGHGAGDELLRQLAMRLSAAAGPDDTVCRLGGDEFVALLAPPTTEADALARAHAFISVSGQPYEWNGLLLEVTLSVGIALVPDEGLDGLVLMRKADAALYAAKQSGRNRAVLFPRPLR
ncbi:sensor domain-containing protein [Luteibacter aegosomatissinici]|uniref:sensor domain-containing protein n=1 Tax=Luteibacter aegosomatissinici TaxID=2911539 RepID=UPI001FF740AC|nr:diguanylate cyclase [Luteibacter aegosomatissinici]UPG92710.1 diguanylate cyclase [Luteibacter aegosomatissinici]